MGRSFGFISIFPSSSRRRVAGSGNCAGRGVYQAGGSGPAGVNSAVARRRLRESNRAQSRFSAQINTTTPERARTMEIASRGRKERPSAFSSLPRPTRSGLALGLLMMLTSGGLAGCATWQAVGVDAEPRPLHVFVDGESVAEIPATGLRLRADRSHILHFEREGYRAQQVVVESVAGPAGPELRPERVLVRLQPVATRSRKIDVQLQSVESIAGE